VTSGGSVKPNLTRFSAAGSAVVRAAGSLEDKLVEKVRYYPYDHDESFAGEGSELFWKLWRKMLEKLSENGADGVFSLA